MAESNKVLRRMREIAYRALRLPIPRAAERQQWGVGYDLEPSPSVDLHSDKSNWVELRGFEPLTSSMPWKRATNCAIAPNGWLGDPSTSKNSS